MQALEESEMRDFIFDGAVLTHIFKRVHLLCTPHMAGARTYSVCICIIAVFVHHQFYT
jgi:hypothetical protein